MDKIGIRTMALMCLMIIIATLPAAHCQFPFMFPSSSLSNSANGFGLSHYRVPTSNLGFPGTNAFAPSWMNPRPPSYNTYNQYTRPISRPASPARQCRNNKLCQDSGEGTTLSTTWRLVTTTPMPTTSTTTTTTAAQ